jgi:hypothetical protein
VAAGFFGDSDRLRVCDWPARDDDETIGVGGKLARLRPRALSFAAAVTSAGTSCGSFVDDLEGDNGRVRSTCHPRLLISSLSARMRCRVCGLGLRDEVLCSHRRFERGVVSAMDGEDSDIHFAMSGRVFWTWAT